MGPALAGGVDVGPPIVPQRSLRAAVSGPATAAAEGGGVHYMQPDDIAVVAGRGGGLPASGVTGAERSDRRSGGDSSEALGSPDVGINTITYSAALPDGGLPPSSECNPGYIMMSSYLVFELEGDDSSVDGDGIPSAS